MSENINELRFVAVILFMAPYAIGQALQKMSTAKEDGFKKTMASNGKVPKHALVLIASGAVLAVVWLLYVQFALA